MSYLYALVYCAALVAFVVLARKAGQRPRANWVWAAPSPLVLAVLAGWGFAGLLEGWLTLVTAPLSAALICGAGIVSLRREEVWDWCSRQDDRRQRKLRVALPVGILVLAMLTIEVPFNSWIPFGGPLYFWLEMILCGLLLLGLYFLAQRHTGLCCLGVAFFFVTGIGQHFVKRFKNSAILPTDLLALSTAAAVTKEYVFSLNAQALMGVAVTMLAVCSLSLVRPGCNLVRCWYAPAATAAGAAAASPTAATGTAAGADTGKAKRAHLRPLANLGASAASFALLAFLVLVPSYMGLFGVQMQYWYSIDYYQRQGFLPTFIAVWQDMPIRKPADYTQATAEELTRAHAADYRTTANKDKNHKAAEEQFARLKPSVIAIMNESFADLSALDQLHAGYKGPQFFKTGFGDALARGTLNVTVHGAGTCNTEFEFLTGNSLSFIGAGKYPYSVYDLSDVDALPAQFKALGYRTCAIHPNYSSNWNRHKVYPQMGFDEYLSIDDFGGVPDVAVDTQTPNEPHCDVFHSGVSDAETYDRILQMLAEDDTPQFFFDVTMANHGSYDQFNIPEEYQQHYVPADYEGEETPERLNEYLACIEKSDDDLKEFVEKLKDLDRPVVLVFFGDHQPSVTASYNDCWYPNESESVHARRVYCSDYVVWANYDVAGRAQEGADDESSVDYLAAQTLDLIGAPVSDYQAAQLDIRALIPSLSAFDYQGENRQWYAPDADGPYAQAYHDLALIEYLNFATRI